MRRCAQLIPLLLLCFVPATVLQAQQSDLLSLQQQLTWTTNRLQMTGFLITSVLLFLMGAACLALWWKARSHKAFSSVGLFLLMISAVFFADYIESHPWNNFLTVLSSLLFIEVTADCLHITKRRWIVPIRLLCAVVMVTCWIPSLAWTFHLAVELSKVVGLALLILRLSRPLPQDRLVLRAIAPAIAIVWFFRLRLSSPFPSLSRLPYNFSVGGWRWYYGPLATVLFGAIAITVFVHELILDQRERQRMAAELEAGRAVQQVLLGTEIPAIPGLSIKSVYKPAGQVGGDFFQIIPIADGGVLAVIGDVSGKGMPAAMTVSLLVGTVRTLAHYTQHPGEILAAMNQRMIGRSNGGFTTCLVLRVDAACQLTLANAGHIPPYLNGSEVAVEAGLPLGIAAGITYPETTFTLPPSARLTLITDGVLEAINPNTKELFGFDRTAAISTQSASEIAAAAQSFGQEDDITVLTVALA